MYIIKILITINSFWKWFQLSLFEDCDLELLSQLDIFIFTCKRQFSRYAATHIWKSVIYIKIFNEKFFWWVCWLTVPFCESFSKNPRGYPSVYQQIYLIPLKLFINASFSNMSSCTSRNLSFSSKNYCVNENFSNMSIFTKGNVHFCLRKCQTNQWFYEGKCSFLSDKLSDKSLIFQREMLIFVWQNVRQISDFTIRNAHFCLTKS